MIPLEHLIGWACAMHIAQTDKQGLPGVFHPLRVMLDCNNIKEQKVAIIHDTIEDTQATISDLHTLGIDQEIIDAVDAISKRENEEYTDYLRRVKANDLAKTVKIVDLRDNLAPNRQYRLDPDKQQRLKLKYRLALEFLLAPTPKPEETITSEIHHIANKAYVAARDMVTKAKEFLQWIVKDVD